MTARRLAGVIAIVAGIAIVVRAAPARAAAPPKRTFALILTAARPELAWRADALAAALAADLVDDRLAYRPAACANGCSDTTLRAAGIELAVRGVVDDAELRWQATPLWSGAPAPAAGTIALREMDRARFAAALRDPLHRLVREQALGDGGAAASIDAPEAPAVAAACAGALVVLAIPFLFAIARGRGARRIVALPALRRTIGAVVLLGGAAIAIAWWGELGPWFVAGGLAWGAFASVTVPLVFPPLVGLGRVEHDELGRALRAWLAIAALRTLVIAALYVPLAIATWYACALVDLDPALRGALAVPVVALVARQVVRCAIAVRALAFDDALVERSPDTDAWHAAVRAYLVGYLRRAGLPVDDELLARVLLLPGRGADVAVYGGGLTPSRIVIPRAMLELALSPWGRPHDYAAPRISTLHWTQWNAGLVMASAKDAPIATPAQRKPREVTRADDADADLDAEPDADPERKLLGEPPTLAGIIEPAALDPRTGYRPHDDPMWLDWDPGDEYDGTDAGDRDFLFGLLVHGLGEIRRGGDRLATLTRRVREPFVLGDLHAALGGARHHLVQALAWRLWQREDLLTARAYAPELEAASRTIFKALAAEPKPSKGDARLRRRLAAMGGLVRGVAVPRPRWRRFVLAGALAAGVAVVALAIADAVRYHDVYAERMRAHPEKTDHGKD